MHYFSIIPVLARRKITWSFRLYALGNNQMHHGAQFTPSSLMFEFANKINRFLLFSQNLTTELKDTKPYWRQKVWNQPTYDALEDHLLPRPLQIGLSQDNAETRSCQHERKEMQPRSQAISWSHSRITAQGF